MGEKRLEIEAVMKASVERTAMDKQATDQEMRKLSQQQKALADIQKHQISQMQQKQAAKRAELELNKAIARQMEIDAMEFEEQKRNKSLAERQRNVQHRMELEKQMQVKMSTQVTTKDSLNEAELRINRRLLAKAQNILGSDAITSR